MVTVMFCDLAGFTGLAEQLGAEQAYSLMEQIYELLIHEVYEYEGTVNELTGDGVMALFGAPVALEDAPQRAVRSALAIHRKVARFNEEVVREGRRLPPLAMRIGINTGPVVVGTLGNDLRVEFKAVGDTVNLASRLQDLAAPGSTLVTEETAGLIEGLFRTQSLGEKHVKGKQEPVRVYRVVAPGTSRTKFEVSAEKGLTPFVGREREIELLLDSFERAREGRGQGVSIVAEAGLGKSRLVYEFLRNVSAGSATVLEGRCLSYCRGSIYYPLIDLLRSTFGLEESDKEDALEAKLVPALEQLGVEPSASLPWLLSLLSASGGGEDDESLDPETRKAQLTRALTRILVAASERRPVIVAIEDLHWIDRSSEDLLGHLLAGIAASSILMICTYRPEYVHTWGARTYHSQLTLNRLSNRETLAMARSHLGGLDLEPSLAELVLQKTEGVPFFVEEFLRSLRDLGLLRESGGQCVLEKDTAEIAVPTTIQDVLRARVDRLPEEAKELLKTASVVGREMSHDLLRRLSGLSEDGLLRSLSVLKDAELLLERGIYPQSTYIFRHALTREVVHDSLLRPKRSELHLKAGKVIESVFSTSLGEHSGVLAEHFTAGENFEKAAEYSRIAARRARYAGAFQEAIEHARKMVLCVSRLPGGDDTLRRAIDARATLAGYLLNLGQPQQAKEVITPVMEDAVRLDHRSAWPALYGSLGLHDLFAAEDYTAAMTHLDKVLATPVDQKSAPWHWFAAYYLGSFHACNCDFERALQYLERVTAMSEAAGRLDGLTIGRATVAFAHVFRGRLDAAMAEVGKAVRTATRSQNPTAEGMAHGMHGIVLCAQGLHAEARDRLLGGLECAGETTQSFWPAVVLTFLGDTFFHLGDLGEAGARYRRAIAILEPEGLLPSWQSVIRLRLARSRACDGEADIRLEELRAWRTASRLRAFEGLAARLVAETLLASGRADLDEVEGWLKAATDADRTNGLELELAHDHACLAELLRRRGNAAAALDNLERARTLFQECGAEGYAAEMARRLATCEADRR